MVLPFLILLFQIPIEWAFHKTRVLPYAPRAMPDDFGLRLLGFSWAFIAGTFFYPMILALVWSSKTPSVKRLRWPVTVLTVLYVITMAVLFVNLKR